MRNRTLNDTLVGAYLNYRGHTNGVGYRWPAVNKTCPAFMEVPLKGETLEVPLLAMPQLKELLQSEADTAVLSMSWSGQTSSYKSPAPIIRDLFDTNFHRRRLIKVIFENSPVFYYGSVGALFDCMYRPLMMASWSFSKLRDDPDYDYVTRRPVLRLSPKLFVERDSFLESFLIGKFLRTYLEHKVSTPYLEDCRIKYCENNPNNQVEVIVDDIPFRVVRPQVPSVLIDNDILLRVLANFKDDVGKWL